MHLRGCSGGGIIAVKRGHAMKTIWNRTVVWRLAAAAVLAAAVLSGCADCQVETGTIEGTWAGVISDTYFCEGGSYTIELDIEGSTITVTGGTVTEGAFPLMGAGTTGTLTHQSGEAYTLTLEIEETAEGQLYVDPQIGYGLLFVHTYPSDEGAFVLGAMQKGALEELTFQDSDLVGDWEGVAVRVDAGLAVTSTTTSSATMYESAGVILDGTDGDGDFSGLITLDPFDPVFVGSVDWPPSTSYEAIGTLSFDKQVLAIAFLTSDCEYNLDLVLPDQKFALWVKQ